LCRSPLEKAEDFPKIADSTDNPRPQPAVALHALDPPMFSATEFREIVSGRRTGLPAATLRAALRAASVPYGWVVRRRNRRFDRGRAEIHRPPVPVVSVGNLTVGGVGKTPMVEWIARRLRQRRVRVAILSRGYGAEEGGLNDEALELELALPDVPHLQNPDRAASAAIAVDELASQLLVLDDGFQHRRLARDLDVVLLDATEPFGFDHVLPRGTLREPPSGLARAQVVVLSRADMLPPAERDAVRRRALALSPHAAWCEVEHRPTALIDHLGVATSPAALADEPVAAFCGIGNPAGFRHTLDALGYRVTSWREFPDHHDYSRDDVDSLAAWARAAGAGHVLCTRKDLVKLRIGALGGTPLRAVGVELRFLAGEEALDAALDPLARRALESNSEMFDESEAG
jgi:tetraacyldisaccharide 4'-kinase